MERKKVSIIIPTFNRSHLIPATLDSIISQTYQDWECIIVDDGSAEETKQLLQYYCKIESRFSFLERPKDRLKGANSCRNLGLQYCSGEFIIFFDSDDLMTQKCLEIRITNFYKHRDKDMLVFSMGYFSNEATKKKDSQRVVCNLPLKQTIEKFILQNKIPWQVSRPIFKSDFIKNRIYFNEKIQNYQDDEFTMRLLKFLEPNYLSLDITDSYYRREEAGKYGEVESKRNIVESWYEYYKTVFDVLDRRQKVRIRQRLIFKFYDQIFGYYRGGIEIKNVHQVLNLFHKQLNLTFIEKFMFQATIF